jgi:DNA phosphorothioation-dependent restriction protein DptG
MAFQSPEKVVQEFGVSRMALTRHATYFGLDVERVSDTGKVLRHVLALGLSQIKKVDSKLFLGVIKELNKITGLHKLPEQNPADIERAEDNRKWANGQIERLMSEYDISRDDAIDLARTHAPTVVKWLM